MTLTAEKLKENYDSLIAVVEAYITGERKDKLIAMYNKYESQIMFAPASAKEHYHNAFPGGYVAHVLNVIEASLKLYEVWSKVGANVGTFTVENLVFCALNHDLGKIGDSTGDYYMPNTSEWHRINQGKIYEFNPLIHHMNVSDRSIFLLQENGIQYSQEEFLGMYLIDGLYEEKNKSYLVTYDKDQQLKTNLPIILHHADMLALSKERDAWRAENPIGKIEKGNPSSFPKKGKSDPQKRNADTKKAFESGMKSFDELFVSGKKGE